VIQLVEALLRRDDVAELVVLAESDSIVATGLEPRPRLRLIAVGLPKRLGLAGRVGWEAARLPRLTATEGADALLTFSGMVPRHPACRIISLVSQPRPFERRGSLKRLLQRWAITRTARRAHRLYVPSQAMADLIGWPEARIVPFGVDRDLFHPADTPGDEVLAVGDFYPHKRFELIVAAWSRLPEPRPTLRLIGNPAVNRESFESVRRLAEDPRVVVAGQVSREELVRVYRCARVFLIASEHESFSMPLAEALCSGVPAVARDLPALRQTAGPGALYVTGDDVDTWSDAMSRVLRDDQLHDALGEAGLRHTEPFTWPAFADTVVADARG
jgi:glycosyltransferase involved in cell wall biosynthesis